MIVDVNGYYAEPTFVNRLAPGEALRLFGTIAGTAIILGSNGDTNNIGFSCGVEGIYTGTAPRSSGVIGQGIDMTDSSGLLGIDGTDLSGGTGKLSAGVRGESRTHFGVLGLSQFEGVSGELLNSSGGFIAGGILGSAFGATPPPGAPWGVWSSGNLGVTGSKNFVEPHSSDPSKIILYASLEGREVGTYFRARARCEDGVARVPVPEDFAMVTDENGLSVQATAIGKLASFAVEILDLNEVVLACSRNVEVFLTVNGIRRAFKDFEPVVSGMEFAPRSPEDRMPLYLTEEAKRRLIANGTYNSDGTVNMETAERVGWIRVWKEREEQDRAAAAAFAASSARLIAPK